MLFNHLWINNKTVGYVDINLENGIGCEESLGNADSLVCGIVESALKPLSCSRDRRGHDIGHNVTGERRDSFASHRVALVCHCGRTYLIFLKRLLNLFKMLKKSEIVCEFCCRLGNV